MFRFIPAKFYKSCFFYLILSFILFCGLYLRLHALLNAHNLFCDEAALLLNIKNSTYTQLFLPLSYNQCCPPVFLIIGKFIYEHFNLNLIALRSIPFIFSLLSLFLFTVLSFKTLKNKFAIILVNFMFAFSPWIFTYQMFFKQYICDIFTTIIILLGAYYLKDKEISTKIIVLFLFLAILCVLTSYTSIIMILSTFIVLVFYKYEKSEKEQWLKNILIFLGLFEIFLINYYYINMETPVKYGDYQNYWNHFIGNYYPQKTVHIKRILNLLSGSMLYPFNVVILSIISGIILFIKDKFTLFISLLPFVFGFILGILKIYPFVPERTILYLIPVFLIFLIKTIDYCPVFSDFYIKTKKEKIISVFSIISMLFFVCSLNIPEFKRIEENLISRQFTNITDYIYQTRYKKEKTSNVEAALKMFETYGITNKDYIFAKIADSLVYNLYDKKKKVEHIVTYDYNFHFNRLKKGTRIFMYISKEFDTSYDYEIFENLLKNCEIELSIENGAYTLIKAKKIKNITDSTEKGKSN